MIVRDEEADALGEEAVSSAEELPLELRFVREDVRAAEGGGGGASVEDGGGCDGGAVDVASLPFELFLPAMGAKLAN